MSNMSTYFILDSINGNHDTKEIKRTLNKHTGVTSVSVNDLQNKVAVDFDDKDITPRLLANKIEKLGYEIIDVMID